MITEQSDTTEITYKGGSDADSQSLPTMRSGRYGKKTTTNTTATLATYTPADGSNVFAMAVVVGRRTDGGNTEAAMFTLRAFYRRSGSSLVAVGTTPEVLAGQPTDSTHNDASASTWTAAFTPNGAALEIQVTGENSKTIHWVAVSFDVTEVIP